MTDVCVSTGRVMTEVFGATSHMMMKVGTCQYYLCQDGNRCQDSMYKYKLKAGFHPLDALPLSIGPSYDL